MNPGFSVRPVSTRVFHRRENLFEFLVAHLAEQKISDGDIIAITSKIVSLAENRIVSREEIDKTTLIKKEADVYLGEIAFGSHLTIKHGLLIASAGIDESNAEGDFYILYPEDPFVSAHEIWKFLREKFNLQNLGVILTDSRTSPLRVGVTGVALAHWGFRPVRDFVGSPDIFGRKLKMTQINVGDALAASATLVMGEAAEKTPLAIISGANVEFRTINSSNECTVAPDHDFYAPVLESFAKRGK